MAPPERRFLDCQVQLEARLLGGGKKGHFIYLCFGKRPEAVYHIKTQGPSQLKGRTTGAGGWGEEVEERDLMTKSEAPAKLPHS